MDFNDTAPEAEYRTKAREWLSKNAPSGVPHRRVREQETADSLVAARAWQATKAEAGYACITWPEEWGGPGGTAIQKVIFEQEESRYPTPGNPFHIGLNFTIATVLKFGEKAVRERFAWPAMRGDEIWCQLFSEPSGGSDLAAVRTRAIRSDGDEWLLNGQKIWTTGAQLADFGMILCRTNPNVPKHKGLTMFWVDMKSPGIDIRPIHEMDGSASFNEVFFTDVSIPDSQRLGGIGEGWKLALYTLMNERLGSDQSGAGWQDFIDLARRTPWKDGQSALKNPAIRERLADWYVQLEGLKHTRNRAITALSRGEMPGPENSIIKLVRANQMLDMANTAIEMMGEYGLVDEPGVDAVAEIIHSSLMWAPGLRIAGGTDEILHNIIAERALGMPGDFRADKDVAFKDIPSGR